MVLPFDLLESHGLGGPQFWAVPGPEAKTQLT